MRNYEEVIAEETKKNREYLGWSQKELAQRSGISRFAIHELEQQKRLPTLTEFMVLDKLFDGNLYWRLTEI